MAKAKELLLFPFNGNAREAASVVEAINRVGPEWNLLGFVDDDPKQWGREFGGYRVLGGREVIETYNAAFILAVPGRPENYTSRKQVISSLQLPYDQWATIVHPTASLGLDTTLGRNTLIMNNVVLTSGISLGDHVIILPNSVIAHDSRIGDYTLVGSNVSISGGVTVGQNCYIGTGSKLIQEISIGEQALVGIGSVVLDDVPSRAVFAGHPAKLIRRKS